MKKHLFFFIALIFMASTGAVAQGGILGKVKEKLKNKSSEEKDKSNEKTSTEKSDESSNNNTTSNSNTESPKQQEPTPIKTYQNYDFVPGDKILFEDHFTDDADGEFATHWELKSGQAVLNKMNGELALYLTDGNYARVSPRMKVEKYLTDPFTIEYDLYFTPGSYAPIVMLKYYDKVEGFERESHVQVGRDFASFSGNKGIELTKNYTQEFTESFDNKWHHVAIAFKNHQLKVYVDQYRMLVVPDTKEDFESIEIAGIGSDQTPVIFKNVRVASGGNMNIIGKKFTDGKIVTHGINFDIDKSTIRPESMGTLNMIVNVLKENPDVKFEIGGHTDNTGTAAHNLILSQQRADAVKDQLLKMGVDASRLTAKGYGNTKPISDNTTLEGKANNRRVEFVKM